MTAQPPSAPRTPGDVVARGEPGDVRGPASARSRVRGRGDRSIVYGFAAAAVGAGVLFVLAGPLSVDTGLLVVAVAAGWATGIAVKAGAAPADVGAAKAGAARADVGASRARVPADGSRRRAATAVALTLAGCAAAWVGTWAWSHVQGGVLGPADFFVQVYGLLVPAQLAFAAAGAAIGSR